MDTPDKLNLTKFSEKIEWCESISKRDTKNKHKRILHRLLEAKLDYYVRTTITKKFWEFFEDDPKDSDTIRLEEIFINAVEFLASHKKSILLSDLLHRRRQEMLQVRLYNVTRTQLIAHRPHNLEAHIMATYTRAFKTFLSIVKINQLSSPEQSANFDESLLSMDDEPDDEDDHVDACVGCRKSSTDCVCEPFYVRFKHVNSFLKEMDIIDFLLGDIVMSVCRVFIERQVSSKCKSNYFYSYSDEVTVGVLSLAKQWSCDVFGLTGDSPKVREIELNLKHYLSDAYAKVRISQMFELIIEYPRSEPAILDLKLCLENLSLPNFRLNLIESLKQSLIKNLLHPGVSTYHILIAYISAIKALRCLDPSGLILQLVTEPIRHYLKSRSDTVRCIVTALTDEEHESDLNREMIRGNTQPNENGMDGKLGGMEMSIPSEGERCTVSNFDQWKPDPIKMNPTDDMKTSRFSDIISILVNIYETKDLFVEEYQKLLSQRLLNKYDECNLDTELRNLELLTLRFTDCELHRCEVMLKDVQISKRINKRILSGDIREHQLDKFKDLDVLIVSSPFWPEKFSPMATLSDEPPDVRFAPEIEEAMLTYTKAFEAIQASRTLHWRHHLGAVDMDVTLNGKVHKFVVSPLHASLLYLFKERKSWRLCDMMHRTSLPAATLRSRLALWQRNGLIRDCGDDKYDLIVD